MAGYKIPSFIFSVHPRFPNTQSTPPPLRSSSADVNHDSEQVLYRKCSAVSTELLIQCNLVVQDILSEESLCAQHYKGMVCVGMWRCVGGGGCMGDVDTLYMCVQCVWVCTCFWVCVGVGVMCMCLCVFMYLCVHMRVFMSGACTVCLYLLCSEALPHATSSLYLLPLPIYLLPLPLYTVPSLPSSSIHCTSSLFPYTLYLPFPLPLYTVPPPSSPIPPLLTSSLSPYLLPSSPYLLSSSPFLPSSPYLLPSSPYLFALHLLTSSLSPYLFPLPPPLFPFPLPFTSFPLPLTSFPLFLTSFPLPLTSPLPPPLTSYPYTPVL